MDVGLGLLIDDLHQQTINSFLPPPPTFCAVELDKLPPKLISPVPVWSQEATYSCAGHGGAAMMSDRQWFETGEVIKYSPWFTYIESQRLGGYFGKDRGTSISSVLECLRKKGCCLESLCPRQGSSYNTNISQAAYHDAAAHTTCGETCVDLRDWESLIAWITDGRPCLIGTKWHSWQGSKNRGLETVELASGGAFLGYHAREIFGYEIINGVLFPRCRNSHSEQFGDKGWSRLTREVWEWFRRDANFFALGFSDMNERIERRDWSKFNAMAGEPSAGGLLV